MRDADNSNYIGKASFIQANKESLSFNLYINIFRDDTIIQIKKPFYGNLLEIEMNSGNSAIFLPSEYTQPFFVPEYLDRNFRYWLRQCIFSKEFNIDDLISGLYFNFKCYKKNDKTYLFIQYDTYIIEGFIKKA